MEWLGKVPVDWEVRRLKSICRLAYGDSMPVHLREDGNTPVAGSNGIVGYHSESNTLAPCIVVGRKGSFGKVQLYPGPVFAIDTTYFIDESLTQSNLSWLAYVLRWANLDAVNRDSAVPGLSREEAYDRHLLLPPLHEQAAIVRYLEYVDRRVRRYVGAKGRLIGLLEEEKQAIISQAVTQWA